MREVLELGRTALCDVQVAGRHHRRPRRRAAGARWPRWPPLGVRLFTDDGTGVQDDRLMRRAMEYAGGRSGVMLAQHCEDAALAGGGHMHEGEWSSRLGIPGQPAEAEELMVIRDIALARLTGARVHFQHLSTAGSVGMVRGGQGRGAAGHRRGHAAPLHAHPRRAAPSYDPVFKVNPPLRTDADVAAVRAGLADGTIDAIATDHAPHTPTSQGAPVRPGASGDARPRDRPGPGPHRARPADSRGAGRCCRGSRPRIAGLGDTHGGPIAAGAPANLCVIDPTPPGRSRRRDGQPQPQHPLRRPDARGRVRHTILAGEPVVLDGTAQR